MTKRSSLTPSRVLVDTSAYFGAIAEGDANDARARAIFAHLGSTRTILYTTNFIIAETHALILAMLGRRIAVRFLAEIHQSTTTIVRATVDDENRALAIIYQYNDKDFSLTDAISFVVVQRLGIGHVFT